MILKSLLQKEVSFQFIALIFALFMIESCGKVASTQNNSDQSSTAASSTNSSNSVPAADDHSAPHITAVSANIIAYTNVEFKVNEDVPLANATYSWSHALDNIPGACLIISGSTSMNYTVNCSKDGTLKVSLQIMQANTQVAVQDFIIPMAASSSPAATASLNADFAISAGTGSKSWNSVASPIEVYVGQTLTITNNDTVKHQMHTGGKPCPHGSAIAAGGGTTKCIITQAYNSITSAGVYEHTVGTSAPIYIIAYDGSQLYTQNCMSCHGALSASQHKGASYAQILNAVANVPDMSSNAALAKLSKKQLEAIAYALSQ